MRKLNSHSLLTTATVMLGLWGHPLWAQDSANWISEQTSYTGGAAGEADDSLDWISQVPAEIAVPRPESPPPDDPMNWENQPPAVGVPLPPNPPAQIPMNWVSQVPAGRGYFAQVDAIWLKRNPSTSTILATLNSPGHPGRPQLIASEDVNFDYEPGLRVRAGMMLNQCTQVEAVYFGINNFNGNPATLNRPPGPFSLNSIYTVLNNTPLQYRADGQTELQNGELNLRRRSGNGFMTASALIGFRYIYIQDKLRLDTFGPPPTGGPLAYETTLANCRNNLFGLQIGGDVGIRCNRLKLAGEFKGILYGDAYQSIAQNVVRDPSGYFLKGPTYRNSSDEDHKATPGVGAQVGLDAAYSLTNNIILHGGYQLLVLSNVAVGSEQLPQVRRSPALGARITNPHRERQLNSILFHGPSAGLEIRW